MGIVIGETLNSSVPAAAAAFAAHNAEAILALAQAQVEGGANYLDINAAVTDDEPANLLWAARLVSDNLQTPLVIDTPSPDAAAYVYDALALPGSILNSVTLESDRFDGMMEIVTRYNTGIVALPVGASGMPGNADERVEASRELVERITDRGVSLDRIYVDLIVEAAGADTRAPIAALDAARQLRSAYPGIHLLAGVSNVSFGLPNRASINNAFLCCLMTAGADAFILNPARESTMLTYSACRMLLGQDAYCMDYIALCRSLAER